MPPKIGNTNIVKAYVGSTPIMRGYAGTTKVFDFGDFEPEPPPELDIWDDVVFQLSQDWAETATIFSGNKTNSLLEASIRNELVKNTIMKPAHLLYSFEMIRSTGNIFAFFDPNNLLAFGQGGEFTLEGWIYTTPHATTLSTILLADYINDTNLFSYFFGFSGSASSALAFAPERRAIFAYSPDGLFSNIVILASNQLPADTWIYLSVCRDSNNVIRLFVNGTMVASQVVPTFFSNVPFMANKTLASHRFSCTLSDGNGGGYYADVRVSRKGIYTSNDGHSIPTVPLPVAYDDGDPHWNNVVGLWRFGIDQSLTTLSGGLPNLSKFGSKSQLSSGWIYSFDSKYGYGSFKPTNQFQSLLQTTHLENFDMKGLTPFTVEAWINRDGSTITARRGISGFWDSTNGRRQWAFSIINHTLELLASSNGTTTFIGLATTTLPTDGWVHVALTRDEVGTFRFHQNGVVVGTITDFDSVDLHDAIAGGLARLNVIGFNGANGTDYKTSELRITKGIARYDDVTFTPPTKVMPAYGVS